MEALVTSDSNGHFGAILLRNESHKLEILRAIMKQASTDSHYRNMEWEKQQAKILSESGGVDDILEWMEENDMPMGRSGGGRIDIVDLNETLPERFLTDLLD